MFQQSQQSNFPTSSQLQFQGYHQHQGNIRPIYRDYYTNSQLTVFIPTFTISFVLSLIFITYIFVDGVHVYIGRVLCIYVLYRYLSIAFSNPGVVYDSITPIETNHHFCKVCQIYVNKFTRHCSTCNVCIFGFDHHCIFIGKCIGEGNISQFKHFLYIIFTTMLYALILAATMTTNIKTIG